MMRPKNLTLAALLVLLLATMLGCAEETETPTETSQLLPETPSLTVPEIAIYPEFLKVDKVRKGAEISDLVAIYLQNGKID